MNPTGAENIRTTPVFNPACSIGTSKPDILYKSRPPILSRRICRPGI
jgi:hypothetical protein